MTSLPEPSEEDVAAITAQLGRPPAAKFAVIVRRFDGTPVVIQNEPHLRDGTPIPTLYWLVDPELVEAVSRIEGAGGVHRFEVMVDATALQQSHDEYAERRTAAIERPDLPAPTGGVGGTRQGVKCLHAHLANHLAGFTDPVGQIVAAELDLPSFVVGFGH